MWNTHDIFTAIAESSEAFNFEHEQEMDREENNSASISSKDSARNASISTEQLRGDERDKVSL